MKNIIFISILTFLSLTACRKEYSIEGRYSPDLTDSLYSHFFFVLPDNNPPGTLHDFYLYYFTDKEVIGTDHPEIILGEGHFLPNYDVQSYDIYMSAKRLSDTSLEVNGTKLTLSQLTNGDMVIADHNISYIIHKWK